MFEFNDAYVNTLTGDDCLRFFDEEVAKKIPRFHPGAYKNYLDGVYSIARLTCNESSHHKEDLEVTPEVYRNCISEVSSMFDLSVISYDIPDEFYADQVFDISFMEKDTEEYLRLMSCLAIATNCMLMAYFREMTTTQINEVRFRGVVERILHVKSNIYSYVNINTIKTFDPFANLNLQ